MRNVPTARDTRSMRTRHALARLLPPSLHPSRLDQPFVLLNFSHTGVLPRSSARRAIINPSGIRSFPIESRPGTAANFSSARKLDQITRRRLHRRFDRLQMLLAHGNATDKYTRRSNYRRRALCPSVRKTPRNLAVGSCAAGPSKPIASKKKKRKKKKKKKKKSVTRDKTPGEGAGSGRKLSHETP